MIARVSNDTLMTPGPRRVVCLHAYCKCGVLITMSSDIQNETLIDRKDGHELSVKSQFKTPNKK